MAHELTIRAGGRAEMAFVGALPWHGLGQRVTEGASLETWAREGGMDWKAIGTPAMYATAEGMKTYGDKQVIYRSDTGEALSVMGKGYQIVQPGQVLEFFRDLTERNEWHIHTVGTLDGGRRMWAMARNHTEGEVVAGDKVKGNLLLATSLDGTMKTTAAMTAIRVVCANTIRAALKDNRDNNRARAVVSHRSQFDAEAVKRDIGVARQSFDAFMEGARKLAETAVSADTARELLRELIGKPTPARLIDAAPVVGGDDFARLIKGTPMPAVKAPKEHRNVSRILELYEGAGMGAQHVGSRGTAWGLLNAVTQFVDHEAARTADNRLTSAWFGRGADLKDETFARLLAL